MDNNFNENLFQAIDTIVSKRLEEVVFDETIQCQIVKRISKDSNEYEVQYNNTIYKAVARDGETYKEKDNVCVSVLKNTDERIILGKYTLTQEDALEYKSPFENLVIDKEISLSPAQSLNLLLTNTPSFFQTTLTDDNNLPISKTSLQGYHFMGFEFGITVMPKGQTITRGDWAIEIRLLDAKGEPVHELVTEHGNILSPYILSSDEVLGNPYDLTQNFKQQKLFYMPQGSNERIADFSTVQIALSQNGNFDAEGTLTLNELNIVFGYDANKYLDKPIHLYVEGDYFSPYPYAMTDEGVTVCNGKTQPNIKALLIDQEKKKIIENLPNGQSIRWYQYKIGEQDDGYGGGYWKYIEPSASMLNNPNVLPAEDYVLDTERPNTQIKAVWCEDKPKFNIDNNTIKQIIFDMNEFPGDDNLKQNHVYYHNGVAYYNGKTSEVESTWWPSYVDGNAIADIDWATWIRTLYGNEDTGDYSITVLNSKENQDSGGQEVCLLKNTITEGNSMVLYFRKESSEAVDIIAIDLKATQKTVVATSDIFTFENQTASEIAADNVIQIDVKYGNEINKISWPIYDNNELIASETRTGIMELEVKPVNADSWDDAGITYNNVTWSIVRGGLIDGLYKYSEEPGDFSSNELKSTLSGNESKVFVKLKNDFSSSTANALSNIIKCVVDGYSTTVNLTFTQVSSQGTNYIFTIEPDLEVENNDLFLLNKERAKQSFKASLSTSDGIVLNPADYDLEWSWKQNSQQNMYCFGKIKPEFGAYFQDITDGNYWGLPNDQLNGKLFYDSHGQLIDLLAQNEDNLIYSNDKFVDNHWDFSVEQEKDEENNYYYLNKITQTIPVLSHRYYIIGFAIHNADYIKEIMVENLFNTPKAAPLQFAADRGLYDTPSQIILYTEDASELTCNFIIKASSELEDSAAVLNIITGCQIKRQPINMIFLSLDKANGIKSYSNIGSTQNEECILKEQQSQQTYQYIIPTVPGRQYQIERSNENQWLYMKFVGDGRQRPGIIITADIKGLDQNGQIIIDETSKEDISLRDNGPPPWWKWEHVEETAGGNYETTILGFLGSESLGSESLGTFTAISDRSIIQINFSGSGFGHASGRQVEIDMTPPYYLIDITDISTNIALSENENAFAFDIEIPSTENNYVQQLELGACRPGNYAMNLQILNDNISELEPLANYIDITTPVELISSNSGNSFPNFVTSGKTPDSTQLNCYWNTTDSNRIEYEATGLLLKIHWLGQLSSNSQSKMRITIKYDSYGKIINLSPWAYHYGYYGHGNDLSKVIVTSIDQTQESLWRESYRNYNDNNKNIKPLDSIILQEPETNSGKGKIEATLFLPFSRVDINPDPLSNDPLPYRHTKIIPEPEGNQNMYFFNNYHICYYCQNEGISNSIPSNKTIVPWDNNQLGTVNNYRIGMENAIATRILEMDNFITSNGTSWTEAIGAKLEDVWFEIRYFDLDDATYGQQYKWQIKREQIFNSNILQAKCKVNALYDTTSSTTTRQVELVAEYPIRILNIPSQEEEESNINYNQLGIEGIFELSWSEKDELEFQTDSNEPENGITWLTLGELKDQEITPIYYDIIYQSQPLETTQETLNLLSYKENEFSERYRLQRDENGKYFLQINERDSGFKTSSSQASFIYDFKHNEKDYQLQIPLQTTMNVYSTDVTNKWAGGIVTINEKEATIMAATIGAGEKDPYTNTFSGVLMGKFKQGINTVSGLSGFNKGQNTFFIDAATGQGIFTGKLKATDGSIANWKIGEFTDQSDKYTGSLYSEAGRYRVFLRSDFKKVTDVAIGIKQYDNFSYTDKDNTDKGTYMFYVTHNGRLSTTKISMPVDTDKFNLTNLSNDNNKYWGTLSYTMRLGACAPYFGVGYHDGATGQNEANGIGLLIHEKQYWRNANKTIYPQIFLGTTFPISRVTAIEGLKNKNVNALVSRYNEYFQIAALIGTTGSSSGYSYTYKPAELRLSALNEWNMGHEEGAVNRNDILHDYNYTYDGKRSRIVFEADAFAFKGGCVQINDLSASDINNLYSLNFQDFGYEIHIRADGIINSIWKTKPEGAIERLFPPPPETGEDQWTETDSDYSYPLSLYPNLISYTEKSS